MTTDELKKEAEKYAKENFREEVRATARNAYLDCARIKEKRIAELEKENALLKGRNEGFEQQIMGLLIKYEEVYKRFPDLKSAMDKAKEVLKENAELEARCNELFLQTCEQAEKIAELEKENKTVSRKANEAIASKLLITAKYNEVLNDLNQENDNLKKENAELRKIAEFQQSSNMDTHLENKKLKEGLAVGETFNKALNSMNKTLEEERDKYRDMVFDLQQENADLKEEVNKVAFENGELKEENAELKKEWQEQVQKATDEGYARTLQTIQLTKAKEHIQTLISCLIDWVQEGDKDYCHIADAENFLKESEVEKNEEVQD